VIKIAIFVEGQTELIFVREYLLKMFDYQNIWIECYTLFTGGDFNTTEYSFPNDNAACYFQVINVGNDNAVLTRLLKREQHLWNTGFHKIVGLRDMYSKNYRESVQNSAISEEINLKYIHGAGKTIAETAKQAENIHFHFAIMEAEAWILGLKNCFKHLDPNLDTTAIAEKLGFNLDEIDPEKYFFHPAAIVQKIYDLAGKNYNKSKGDINAIMSHIHKDDFADLSKSGKCRSFGDFSINVIQTNLP
jgi:hypothetical protein